MAKAGIGQVDEDLGMEYLPRPGGYDRLGQLMGELPELAAFRKFGALAAEDLLYRQAELLELERSLREYQKEDKESRHEDREHYANDWDKLHRSNDEDAEEGNDGSQLRTILQIRKKLKEYYNALLRYNKIVKLRRPLLGNVQRLHMWMSRTTMGDVYLEGEDSKIWSDPDMDDMVNLKSPSAEDSFTSEITLKLVRQYNSMLGRHIHREETKDYLRNTIRYRDEGIFQVLKTLTTLIACLLPIAGIAVLYTIHDMTSRIGATAAFTALFSFTLNLTTGASTKDIFGATAAFAAVLVVFIGTTTSDSPESNN